MDRRIPDDDRLVTQGVAMKSPSPQSGRLLQVAGVFLKLGSIAFGGPAAHVGIMEQEIVRRRGWLGREEFLDLLAISNIIPGPNSTEMAIFIGYRRAGWAGLLVAGACFIIPAMLVVTVIAWGYTRVGTLPEAAGVLYGVKPVIIPIVLQALWSLGRTAVKTPVLFLLGACATVASALGVNPLLVLFGTGVAAALTRLARYNGKGAVPAVACFWPWTVTGLVGASGAGMSAGTVPFGLWPLFLFFLKVGAVIFGSGYVLLAFLQADLVQKWGWLTEHQLLDAIAVGQVTPGPLFTTATFIGYILAAPQGTIAGVVGGVVATVGIFLPSFIFVSVAGPLVKRVRQWPVAGSFLDGVIAAALALMAVVTFELATAALVDVVSVAISVVALLLLLRFRVNTAWLVLGGGLLGLVKTLL